MKIRPSTRIVVCIIPYITPSALDTRETRTRLEVTKVLGVLRACTITNGYAFRMKIDLGLPRYLRYLRPDTTGRHFFSGSESEPLTLWVFDCVTCPSCGWIRYGR